MKILKKGARVMGKQGYKSEKDEGMRSERRISQKGVDGLVRASPDVREDRKQRVHVGRGEETPSKKEKGEGQKTSKWEGTHRLKF